MGAYIAGKTIFNDNAMKYYIKKPQYSPVTLRNEWYYLQEQDGAIWELGKEKAAMFSEEVAKGWLQIMGSGDMQLEPVQTCPEGEEGSRPDLDMIADAAARICADGDIIEDNETKFKRVTATEIHEGVAYKRQEILKIASDLISNDRQRAYGTPAENFALIANLWNDYLHARGISTSLMNLIKPADVAVLNMLQKIARIVASPDKDENWIDIAGYAGLGAEVANPK